MGVSIVGLTDFVSLLPAWCHEDVIRKGESQPCDKAAVAARIDPTEGRPYPVCAYHARGDMVPLRDLIVAAVLSAKGVRP